MYDEVEIKSEYTQAKEIEDRIVEQARACGYHDEDLFALRLSLEEALSNAIRHGNADNVQKKVGIRYTINSDRVDIYVTDEGAGFDPGSVPDPRRVENLELPSGRGIMLMRAYMNQVEYNKVGNQVHLTKLNRAG